MITPPEVSISEIALSAFRDAAREAGDGEVLRLTIDAKFHNDLYFAAIEPNDVVIVVSGLELAMDARTARRANGLKIDFVDGAAGPGFKLDNPNQDRPIRGIHPVDVARARNEHKKLQLIDVRPAVEQAKARVEGARQLDPAYQAELDALPKDAKLVFLAHHSSGAKAAARLFYDRGFHNVWYVVGGIDAWATMDQNVRRY